MIYLFVILLFIGTVAIGLHEAQEQDERVAAAKEKTLSEFCYWLSFYEEECVNSYWPITSEEVKTVQSELDRLANKLAYFYPGFTAPRLV